MISYFIQWIYDYSFSDEFVMLSSDKNTQNQNSNIIMYKEVGVIKIMRCTNKF